VCGLAGEPCCGACDLVGVVWWWTGADCCRWIPLICVLGVPATGGVTPPPEFELLEFTEL
jgi:hypothetical protein